MPIHLFVPSSLFLKNVAPSGSYPASQNGEEISEPIINRRNAKRRKTITDLLSRLTQATVVTLRRSEVRVSQAARSTLVVADPP